MPAPLGVQQSNYDNGTQHSTDPDDLRGISSSASEDMPGARLHSDEQRPMTKRARIAREMTDADLFEVTGLADRAEAEARYAEDRSLRRPRRNPDGSPRLARTGLVL